MNIEDNKENEESQNRRSFESLVSVTFANRSKMIEIVYHERAERDDQEQQAYLADIKEKYKFSDDRNDFDLTSQYEHEKGQIHNTQDHSKKKTVEELLNELGIKN